MGGLAQSALVEPAVLEQAAYGQGDPGAHGQILFSVV
jgi:hypothetical protein